MIEPKILCVQCYKQVPLSEAILTCNAADNEEHWCRDCYSKEING